MHGKGGSRQCSKNSECKGVDTVECMSNSSMLMAEGVGCRTDSEYNEVIVIECRK